MTDLMMMTFNIITKQKHLILVNLYQTNLKSQGKMLASPGAHPQRQVRNPIYGQLVIGPPGSGKTTYCSKIYEFYKELDRKVAVVNLDPANDQMEYNAKIDIVHQKLNFEFQTLFKLFIVSR